MRTGIVAVGASVPLKSAGRAAARQDAVKKGGTLTFGHFGDVDNYDPLTSALDMYQNYGRLMIFSSLTAYDVDLNLIGDLATSWELEDTNWVFKLREGVTWHDGSPFTGDDVKYTFERSILPDTGSFILSYVGGETTVDVLDPLTVRINLPAVNASFPDILVAVPIVKNESGDASRDQPVGTGPFKFESWSPNEETVYVRNENYYDPERPYLDKVIFRPTPDPQVAITNLTAGSLDTISNQLVLPQTAATLEGQEGLELLVVDPSTALVYGNIISREGPLSDKRVRQGLAMCLDLETIKELVYAGRGTPTNNFMTQLSWAYVDIPNYPFDPEKAKALFAEAGYPDGFTTSILTLEGYPDLIAIGPIWQDGLKKAGVEATVEQLEINTWLDRFLHSEYEISLNFDINGPDPQRMFVADFLLHVGFDEWGDKELQQKVTDGGAAAIATADQEARKKVYADLQQLMFDELPVIPIYRPAIITGVAAKVEGFAIDGKGFYHFDRAWINE